VPPTGRGQGQLSSSLDLGVQITCTHQSQLHCAAQSRCGPHSPECWNQQEAGPAPLSHAFRAGSPLPSRPAPLCCPGNVQGPLSLVLQPVRSRVTSSVLMTTEPALPTATGAGRGGGGITPCPCHITVDTWWEKLSLFLELGADSHTPSPHTLPTPPPPHPTTKASSTVLLRQGTGPALLSVVLYVPERARASSAQSLDIHVVSGCSHQGCLHVSSNNMNHGPTPATAWPQTQTRPSALAGTSSQPQVATLAIQNRTLNLCFSFSPTCICSNPAASGPHSRPLGDLLCPYYLAGQQAGLCMPTVCPCGMAVGESLRSFFLPTLHGMVACGPLCVLAYYAMQEAASLWVSFPAYPKCYNYTCNHCHSWGYTKLYKLGEIIFLALASWSQSSMTSTN
jgi:hypothetical protein